MYDWILNKPQMNNWWCGKKYKGFIALISNLSYSFDGFNITNAKMWQLGVTKRIKNQHT